MYAFVLIELSLEFSAARDDRLRSAWDVEHRGGLCKFLREEIGVHFIPFGYGLGSAAARREGHRREVLEQLGFLPL